MIKKRYISYSEYNTYINYGKDAYFKSYILGIREPANKYMIFGSIVHNVLADENYNWEKEIKQLTDEPQETYKRIIEKIIVSVPRCEHPNENLFVDLPEFSLFAGIDGYDDEVLTEYKTGGSLWTQEQADTTDQITHYTLTWRKAGKKDLPFRLISISSKNGKFIERRTYRTQAQLDEYYQKLINFKKELIELGWWDKKARFNKRINL